ncbi:MAG: GxxExxY protein [bacterium]
MITERYINELCYEIIGCAIEVHKFLGPGLIESVYECCVIEELKAKNLEVKSQIRVAIYYKGKDRIRI